MEIISQPDYPDDSSGRLSSTLRKPKGGNYCLDDSWPGWPDDPHPAGLSERPSPSRVIRTTFTWPRRPDDLHLVGLSGRPSPGWVVETTLTQPGCPGNPYPAGLSRRLSVDWVVQMTLTRMGCLFFFILYNNFFSKKHDARTAHCDCQLYTGTTFR